MENLNKIYDNDQLFYWCNAAGDINIPGTDPWSLHDVDELPLKERNLYENYWSEDMGFWMYVVNYKGNPAMAINCLFDKSYLADLLDKEDVSQEDMKRFYNAVFDFAMMLEREKEVAGCEILIGEDTDPDGHELFVIIPYDKRSEIVDIARYLDGCVYSTVESLL